MSGYIPPAASGLLGGVMPDGTTTTVDTDGTIHATGSGPQGAQGAQGPQGPGVGTQGAQGPTGPQGTQGPGMGAQGPQGSQGPTGPQGPQGSRGNTGVQGATGAQGPVGYQGFQGTQGATGNTGAQGAQGPGAGAQGATGPQGSQGSTGPQGNTGPQGFQGVQGAGGGSTGSQGPQGPQGPQGHQGSQGVLGGQGPTGAQGPTGGATGSQGPQGPQGDTGATGAQGASEKAPTLLTFQSGTLVQAYDLIVTTGPAFSGSPPSNWQTVGFDDSAWAFASVSSAPTIIPPASTIWITPDNVAYDECLFRQHFYLPTNAAASTMQIQLEAYSQYEQLYINGHLIDGANYLGTDVPSPGMTYQIPVSYLNLNGADNVLALWVKAQNDTAGAGPAWIVTITGIQAPTGPTGPQGYQGPQGLRGDTGTQGAQGPQGSRGPQGFQGDTGGDGGDGTQGPQGPQGTQGSSGLSALPSTSSTFTSSIAALGYNLWNGTSNDDPPSGWQGAAYDDSAWDNAVVAIDNPPTITGADWIVPVGANPTSGLGTPDQAQLIRHHFRVSGLVATASLHIFYDTQMPGLYLNGTFIPGGVTEGNVVQELTVDLPSSAFVVGDNVLAIYTYDFWGDLTPPPGDHYIGGVTYRVTIDTVDGTDGVAIYTTGTLIGTERGINFIAGDNITLTVTDDPTDDRVNVTIASSGGGGEPISGDLIAVTSYAQDSDTDYTTTSTSFVDVDTDNLKVTFTAPSSGNVIVRVNAIIAGSNSSHNLYFNLRESGSDIAGTSHGGAPSSSTQGFAQQAFDCYLTGLSAGTHTLTLGYRTDNAATAAQVWSGPTLGPVTLEVFGQGSGGGGTGPQGPTGPQGATGATGPQGPQGASGGSSAFDTTNLTSPVDLPAGGWTTVLSLTPAAGDWLMFAGVTIEGGSGQQVAARLKIGSGSGDIAAAVGTMGTSTDTASYVAFSLTSAKETLDGSTAVALQAWVASGTPDASAIASDGTSGAATPGYLRGLQVG